MKEYVGNELELFKYAHNWKRYYSKKIKPLLKGDVLEVGAGIGHTTHVLCNGKQNSWVCLEPDNKLAKEILLKKKEGFLPPLVEVKADTLNGVDSNKKFDAILYIDVIEHIENDLEELKRASTFLKPEGYLIVLVPAHNFLFSEFDKAIGHYRRYNKKMLRSVVPTELQQQELYYLDSMGLFASLINKLFLKQQYPTIKQIKFWDNYIIPMSKVVDFLLPISTGKTVVGIWKKPKDR
jgi:SAM-dependent methyltransferase